MNNYDGIIFDLDGTLWDSTETILHVWKEVLKNNPNIKKEINLKDIKSCMGLLKYEIGEKLFPKELFEASVKNKLMNEAESLEKEYLRKFGAKIYPEVIETLDFLSKKYKLFIVSNCQDGYIQAFLELNKLSSLIQDFECPGITGQPKGENIKLVIARNNLKNAIYVGDTLKDYEACKFAGVPFIFAAYGFGDVSDFTYKIESFKDLKNFL